METEVARIKQMLKNSWDGPMWHGANLKEILTEIDYQKAFRKPTAGSHNIYELLIHMTAWRKFVIENLKGNSAYKIEVNSEADWVKNYEPNETSWKSATAAFEQSQTELVDTLNTITDKQLEELVPGKKFNWYVFLHGVIHHDIYHSAQIAILKK